MIPALVGLICVAASGVILVALHVLPTGLNPIRYAVSDYGWTPYHLGYRTMVVLQGAGALLIAIGLGQQTDAQSLGWLVIYGIVRLLICGFMIDREPAGIRSMSWTGRIHMLLAGTAFASIALAASSLDFTRRARPARPAGPDRVDHGHRDRDRPRRAADPTRRARRHRADPLRGGDHLADRGRRLDPVAGRRSTATGRDGGHRARRRPTMAG